MLNNLVVQNPCNCEIPSHLAPMARDLAVGIETIWAQNSCNCLVTGSWACPLHGPQKFLLLVDFGKSMKRAVSTSLFSSLHLIFFGIGPHFTTFTGKQALGLRQLTYTSVRPSVVQRRPLWPDCASRRCDRVMQIHPNRTNQSLYTKPDSQWQLRTSHMCGFTPIFPGPLSFVYFT